MTYQLLNDWSREALQNDLAAIPGPHSYTTPELRRIIDALITRRADSLIGDLEDRLRKCTDPEEREALIEKKKRKLADEHDAAHSLFFGDEGTERTIDDSIYRGVYLKAYAFKLSGISASEVFVEFLPAIKAVDLMDLWAITDALSQREAEARLKLIETKPATTKTQKKKESLPEDATLKDVWLPGFENYKKVMKNLTADISIVELSKLSKFAAFIFVCKERGYVSKRLKEKEIIQILNNTFKTGYSLTSTKSLQKEFTDGDFETKEFSRHLPKLF